MEIDWCWNNVYKLKWILFADTSFLMVLCYEPIKEYGFFRIKIWKTNIFDSFKNYQRINTNKTTGNIKRSKIANLALEVINKETKNKNFKYLMIMLS